MKSFSHIIFLSSAVIVIFISILFLNNQVNAGAGDNVYGWAWSSNIGWISMNDTNASSGGGNYGVRVDASGNISGWAWSPHIGWISFNPVHVANCPAIIGNTSCAPNLNPATGEIHGWARACAGTVNKDCTGEDRTDGWNGWISLRGANPNYGVTTTGSNRRNWSGFAWGGQVVGWISFSGRAASGEEYGVYDTGGRPTLSVACSSAPNPAAKKQEVTWSPFVSGGIQPYTYLWDGDEEVRGNGLIIKHKYNEVGVKKMKLTVTDSNTPRETKMIECQVMIGSLREVAPTKVREIIPE